MYRILTLVAATAFVGSAAGAQAQSQTAKGEFNVSMTISKTCTITGGNTMTFSPANNLLVAGTASSTNFDVKCTNTTPYSISLNQGTGSGATTATRRLTHASTSETVPYQLFSDANRTVNWGEGTGETVGGQAGTGAAVTHNVYGKIAAGQTNAPAPGLYTDVVTITVTY